MLLRKFDRDDLEPEPHKVHFKDLYPWDGVTDTYFNASVALVEPGGHTELHHHDVCETFVIVSGNGVMVCNDVRREVGPADTVYAPPGTVHMLRNESPDTPLVFFSMYWHEVMEHFNYSPVSHETPRVVIPSPPSSNGPLHLGHLAGPFVAADVYRRFSRLCGVQTKLVCATDDHQSYVVTCGADHSEMAARIFKTLNAVEAAPDVKVRSHEDEGYRKAVLEKYEALKSRLTVVEADTCYCENCQKFLYDGFLYGDCSHCGSSANGFNCQTCGFPNDGHDLEEVHCNLCDQPTTTRKLKRLFLNFEPHREALAEYHYGLSLGPALRAEAARLREMAPTLLPISQPGEWGLAVDHPEVQGQILSPWAEMTLAHDYLVSRAGLPGAEIVHFFGSDNAYLYLLHDPAILLALNSEAVLPQTLVCNEFLMLDEEKMSTSKNHVLWANELLDELPADLLRFYLAYVRPESDTTSCSYEHLQETVQTHLVGECQDWLAELGQKVALECSSQAPGAEALSPEQWDFQERIGQWLDRAQKAYGSNFSLRNAARILLEIIEETADFARLQEQLKGVESLLHERQNGIALELAAARAMALISAPLMPEFSEKLWSHLGYAEELEDHGWDGNMNYVPPDQRVLGFAGLASRSYFSEED